jgi:hypothetical protein
MAGRTARGSGPFVPETRNESLLRQAFLESVAMVRLPVTPDEENESITTRP